MEFTQSEFISLLVSLIIGSAIGIEREFRNKSAGFRTIIITCLGSTLFTIFSLKLGALTAPERIASNIVVGIGFLGAGVIFKEENRIAGLTTATTIWIASALGMGVGGGYYMICLVATILVLFVLYGFMIIEKKFDEINKSRRYKIVCPYSEEGLLRYEKLFKQYHLKSTQSEQMKYEGRLSGTWMVHGKSSNHELLKKELLKDDTIEELTY